MVASQSMEASQRGRRAPRQQRLVEEHAQVLLNQLARTSTAVYSRRRRGQHTNGYTGSHTLLRKRRKSHPVLGKVESMYENEGQAGQGLGSKIDEDGSDVPLIARQGEGIADLIRTRSTCVW